MATAAVALRTLWRPGTCSSKGPSGARPRCDLEAGAKRWMGKACGGEKLEAEIGLLRNSVGEDAAARARQNRFSSGLSMQAVTAP
jgi:hypothetical protein